MNAPSPLNLTDSVEALHKLLAQTPAADIVKALRRLPRENLRAIGDAVSANPIVTLPGPGPDYAPHGCLRITGCPRRADAVRFLMYGDGYRRRDYANALSACSDIEHGKPLYENTDQTPVAVLRVIAKRWRNAGFTVEEIIEDAPETHTYDIREELGHRACA